LSGGREPLWRGLGALVLIGCASPSASKGMGGVPALDGASGGPADATTNSIALYTWKAEWGPCRAQDAPCFEQFVAAPTGLLTHTLMGLTMTATLNGSDIMPFMMFLSDPTLVAAISGPPCCAASPDRMETVKLTLADGRLVSKNVVCCAGSIYDAIGRWSANFGSYFPVNGSSDASTD
jgi:hypothetical protein